jgi:hypothetical protein
MPQNGHGIPKTFSIMQALSSLKEPGKKSLRIFSGKNETLKMPNAANPNKISLIFRASREDIFSKANKLKSEVYFFC